MQNPENIFEGRKLYQVVLVAVIPLFYFYFLFYAFHQQIITFHAPSQEMINKVIDPYTTLTTEHDGIEPFVLLLMMLSAGPLLAYLLCRSFFQKECCC